MARSFSTHMKEAFKGTWELSAQKEAFVKSQIERFTDLKVVEQGFGAGSTDYIEGASGDHGYEKAAPDLQVLGTNVCIEVTGPLRPIRVQDDLLINVSKIKYAFEHPEREYWVAHSNGVTKNRQGVRMIRVGQQFDEAISRGVIVREQFESRNVMQFFHAVPCDHHVVISFDKFILYLQMRKENEHSQTEA